MKILLLTRYGVKGASSRLRSYQYLPHLRSIGYQVDVAPFFDDRYLDSLYKNESLNKFRTYQFYAQRVIKLLSVRKYDLVWIEKELFPWFPAVAEFLLFYCKVPYIVDYDDAIFHRYDQHSNGFVRKILKHKIDVVMRHAALVIVGNDYLYERATKAGATWVEYLPTVIDLERYRLPVKKKSNDSFVVGWIGTETTARYLELVTSSMAELAKEYAVKFVAIGPRKLTIQGVPWETISWSEKTEVEDVYSFDVGIMPLENGLWERGKCGYKLIQYMACARPVIASPVGVNTKIVDHGKTGFLPSTDSEWRSAVKYLIDHPDAAEKIGASGREKVVSEYSLQGSGNKLAKLLEQAVVSGLY